MRYYFLSVLLLLSASACKRDEVPTPAVTTAPAAPPALPIATTPTDADDPFLATVNDKPISLADVRMALRLTKPTDEIPEGQLEPVLDGLIRQEIIAQAAATAGLDKDAKYQAELTKAMAPANAFRRRALGDAYFHAETAKLPPVTDAEAQQFFDDNKANLASDVRVEQLLTRNQAEAEAALKEIQGGKTIGDVTRKAMPNLAPSDKPWELDWQPWQLIPEQWRAALPTMKPGDVSGVLPGPGKRFWIIKLVDRRPSKTVDFASAKAGIIQHLTDVRAEATRTHLADGLIPAAKIVRHKASAKPAAPAPAE